MRKPRAQNGGQEGQEEKEAEGGWKKALLAVASRTLKNFVIVVSADTLDTLITSDTLEWD